MAKHTQQIDDKQDRLVKLVNERLDESVEALDARTVSKLNQARHRALESKTDHRARWFVFAVLASVVVLVANVMLNNTVQTNQAEQAVAVSVEYLELAEELEFVSWLSAQDEAS